MQVEILEVECIMSDFFEAGITNMVREGQSIDHFYLILLKNFKKNIGKHNIKQDNLRLVATITSKIYG